MDRLIVKNFGPLKDVDIELNKINLFIGENGSGKSVLAKLVTILTNLEIKEKNFFQKLDEFQINYVESKTLIKLFSSKEQNIYIKVKQNKLDVGKDLESLVYALDIKDDMLDIMKKISEKAKNVLDKDEFEKMKKDLKEMSSQNYTIDKMVTSQYIPAERNLISIFNKYVTTFITANIPLPKFLLNFSSQYVRAREEIRELNLLNVTYKFQSDQERIFYNDENYLLLEQSSSGIQSALPLYLTVKYFTRKHKSIIIEEPEQNLFPKAQKEIVEYIVEHISDENSLFMMTHSPYILTALNNLILANDIKNQKGIESIDGIVKENQCVDFQDVSAYTLIDGKSIDIMDKEDRLIGVNLIDSISDEVNETFDKLLAKLD